MSYILSNGVEHAHVPDAAMLETAERLAGSPPKPIAIWQHFGLGAPRLIVAPAGLTLPDPLPPLMTPAAAPVEPIVTPKVDVTGPGSRWDRSVTPSANIAKLVNASGARQDLPAPPVGTPAAASYIDTTFQDSGDAGVMRPREESQAAAPAPAPSFSTFGAQVVDQDAKTRIDAQQAALREAGFKGIGFKGEGGDGEQFFANGTRMGADGYATQDARKVAHEAQGVARDAAGGLRSAVQAERRQDQIVSAAEIGRSIAVNGSVSALGGYKLGEHAIRGLLTRLDSDATSYVLGLRNRIAASVAVIGSTAGDHTEARKAMAEDKAKIAEILAYECLRPHAADTRVTMRLRDASRDCYAVLGPAYSPADAPRAIDEILPELPRDARGSFSYDPASTAWELRAEVWTPTPVAKQAVGEAFSAHVSFTSRDNGTSRFRGGGGILLLRCLNASTYLTEGAEVARVHRGNVLGDVRAMMRGSLKAIDALCAAWGKNREAEIDVPGGVPIEVAIPGFWRSLLTSDRELVGVLAGKKEEHVTGLTRAYMDERRDPARVVKADLAQGWTRYVQGQPTDVRRDAEAAIGSWLVAGRAVGFAAPREPRASK